MQTEDTSKQNAPPFAKESGLLAFARRVLIATLVVASVVLVLLFVWYAADLLMLVFAGILVSILLRGFSRFLSEKTSIGRGFALALVALVAIIAAGLCGFILRRFVQIFVPPNEGVPPKPFMRVLRRVGFALSGLAHLGIALAALRLVLGLAVLSPDGQKASRGWATLLLVWKPLDGWLTVLARLVVLGVAVFYCSMAVRRRFTIDLHHERMGDRMRRAAIVCGIVGYAGRGVAFLIVGLFLVYAGWFVEEVEARGLSDILRTLETRPWGSWMLITVAVGLIVYGLYLLLAARYLRLLATW